MYYTKNYLQRHFVKDIHSFVYGKNYFKWKLKAFEGKSAGMIGIQEYELYRRRRLHLARKADGMIGNRRILTILMASTYIQCNLESTFLHFA